MEITLINDWWCSTDVYIGTSDTSGITDRQKHNANKFFTRMTTEGFSKTAICAILGNAQVESLLSPAFTETRRTTLQSNSEMLSYDRGLGLVQWTGFNADGEQKLVAYCERYGWNWYDGEAQCSRIVGEKDNNLQFNAVTVGGVEYTWSNFWRNTDSSLEDLTKAWCWGYERASDPDMDRRIANAEYWYENVGDIGLPKWLLAIVANRKKEVRRPWQRM